MAAPDAMAEPRPRRAAPSGRARGRQGGEGRGRRGRRGLLRDGGRGTDAATAVPGDENDGERRKKRRGGERDEHGATPRLTGGPHMQRRRLPNRLRTGRASAPRPRAGGWAALSRAAAALAQDAKGKGGERSRPRGGRRLGCGRLAGPRREKGAGRGGWAAAQAGLKGEEGRRERKRKDFSFLLFLF
jgi:hypothetical protein